MVLKALPRKQVISTLPFWIAAVVGSLVIGLLLLIKVDLALILLALLALPAGIVFFLHPELALYLLVFLVFTHAPEAMSLLKSLPSVTHIFGGFIGLIILLRLLLFGERILNFQRPLVFMFTFMIMAFASLLYAKYPDATLKNLSDLFKACMVVLLMVLLIRNVRTLNRVVWTLLFAGILLGTLSTIQEITKDYGNSYWGLSMMVDKSIIPGERGLRLGGPDLEPNSYALFLQFLVPLAFDRLFSERRLLLRILAGWALVVTLLTISFTYSRGIFLSLPLVIILMIIWHPPKLTSFLGILLVGILLVLLIPSQYTQRLSTITQLISSVMEGGSEGLRFGTGQDSALRGRLSENIAALQIALDHPVIGVGYDNMRHYYLSYSQHLGLSSMRDPRPAHNLYLELASEFGIVGLLWFFVLNVVAFRGLAEAKQIFQRLGMDKYASMVIAFGIALVGYLAGSIFLHIVYPRYFWMFYALILIIPHLARRELNERLAEE
jgi:O-antigen ligase